MRRAEHADGDLSDIRLRPARRADSALRLDRRATAAGWDLDTVRGPEAIGQAAWLALATPRGSLAHLGHARFGSRLHLLIGEPLDARTLSRAAAYVREALRDDPRFRLLGVALARHPADPGALEVQIDIEPGGAFTFPLGALIGAAEGGP
ncbi:GPW/gp25 family protein [Rhodobaculum claviforme]|uniref:Uncharacterized protein n=1 Tax=Rhodobaculum claviforme TaxID=1549854 RepID=A0A934WI41_9RHOB|nr:GPW/gp25 family protein [Rhodobaculum claviforme]MBK5926173.1 hypothetical protein [Rhodobaculum claviforme]